MARPAFRLSIGSRFGERIAQILDKHGSEEPTEMRKSANPFHPFSKSVVSVLVFPGFHAPAWEPLLRGALR